MLSVGCAVGLGNVWRFPYVAGKNGGALFVLLYIFFMIIFGIPIMTMEFSLGRASQSSVAVYYSKLRPDRPYWKIGSYVAVIANYVLMMFYTTIAGWTLNYLVGMIKGDFVGASMEKINGSFDAMLSSPCQSVFWMILAVLIGFGICAMGLQNGVESITKVMMFSLFIIMGILMIRAVTLPNAINGLKFYLLPNIDGIKSNGLGNIVAQAMAQAFFSLSVGAGGMAIFGSYIDKNRSLMGEAVNIVMLDLAVAIISGVIVFCACSAFGVDVGAGPKLVFVTLPNIFNEMPAGQLWGILFFLSMTFAAMSTIIGVFENIVSFGIDLFGLSRNRSVFLNSILVVVLSIPCALSFNLWNNVGILGFGIFDIEDFIVSNNLLPLGALICVLFCASKSGWGYKNLIEESNQGKGVKFPNWLSAFVKYVIPIMIIYILLNGYFDILQK